MKTFFYSLKYTWHVILLYRTYIQKKNSVYTKFSLLKFNKYIKSKISKTIYVEIIKGMRYFSNWTTFWLIQQIQLTKLFFIDAYFIKLYLLSKISLIIFPNPRSIFTSKYLFDLFLHWLIILNIYHSSA